MNAPAIIAALRIAAAAGDTEAAAFLPLFANWYKSQFTACA